MYNQPALGLSHARLHHPSVPATTDPYTQRPATEEAVEAAAKYLESTLKQLMEVLDAIMEEREDVFDGDY